jgi:hypothetical protein
MNSKLTSLSSRTGLLALLLAGGIVAAPAASSIITFSVDMSAQVAAGTFTNGVNPVSVHGTFNTWGAGLALTNDPSAANPNVYSGTLDDTVEANGAVTSYKFVYNDGTDRYETPTDGQNRAAYLPATSGGTLVLPTPFYADAGPLNDYTVTFQVDMAQQINIGTFDPNSGSVELRGTFEGWSGGYTLTNDPSILRTNQYGLVTTNVYTGTFVVSASPFAAEDYKYVIQPGTVWEQPSAANADGGGNRFYLGATQTLPIVFFSDAPYAPVVTNNVTFQVDMTAQVLSGLFDPSLGDVADVRGNFNNWTGLANVCTNDPSAPNTNIYTTVVTITDGVGATEQYKFVYSGHNGTTWENPAPPTIGGNRFFVLANASSQVLPLVNFSDLSAGDLVPAATEVTFTVDMTGAVGTDSHVFDPAADSVYINSDFLGWPTWNIFLPQMTNNPVGSPYYAVTLNIPQGNPLQLTYKYSINGADDEAGFAQNHVRFVRTVGTYTLPTDKFGNQHVEPSWLTNVTIGKLTGSTVPVSWLGRPGLHLQTATSLNSPTSWQDILATDGANWTGGGILSSNGLVTVTNFPATGSAKYFRLIKPSH